MSLQEERPQHANPRLSGLLPRFRSMWQMCRWLRRRPILTRHSVTTTRQVLRRRPPCCPTTHRPRSLTPPRYTTHPTHEVSATLMDFNPLGMILQSCIYVPLNMIRARCTYARFLILHTHPVMYNGPFLISHTPAVNSIYCKTSIHHYILVFSLSIIGGNL